MRGRAVGDRGRVVSGYIGWLVTGITWEGAQDEQHIHTRMDLDGSGGKGGVRQAERRAHADSRGIVRRAHAAGDFMLREAWGVGL